MHGKPYIGHAWLTIHWFFVLRGAFFSRYVQLKSFFSDEKTSAVKSETYFSREATENQRGKGNFHHWQKLELCKVIHSAKLH